jgi:hypothetical protein
MNSVPGVVGDADGIRLWTLMASTTDAREQDYFRRLQTAASQYGEVYFSDLLTQIETGKNQTTWRMHWVADQNNWNVVVFHVPMGQPKLNERLTPAPSNEQDTVWENVSTDDLVE